MGANDFCLDMCYHKNPQEIVKQHEQDLLTVLRTLRDFLPRTIVNVVVPPSRKSKHFFIIAYLYSSSSSHFTAHRYQVAVGIYWKEKRV